MSLQGPPTTVAGAVVGGTAVTSPAWLTDLPLYAQLGGLALIGLTGIKLVLEIRKLLQRDKER